jgi:rRNA maturation endonuclease Nob1
MGQVTGRGPRKAFKFGKKGQISCPDCGNFVPVIKLPINLPFVQKRASLDDSITPLESDSEKTCKMCGQKIKDDAKFCNYCGEAV